MDALSGLSIIAPSSLSAAVEIRNAIRKNMEAREKALHKVNEEYQRAHNQLVEEIQKLEAELDSVPLISHLPSEILTMILEEYVREYRNRYCPPYHEYANTENTITPYGWFKILHVCRDWRRAAFSTRRIWTYVVHTDRHCVDFMLSLSGKLPLTIQFNHPHPRWEDKSNISDAHDSTFRELSRIRSAQWRFSDPVLQCFLRRTSDSRLEAPILEDLTLDIRVENDTMLDFSTMDTPRLNLLNITGGSATLWGTLARPTLTHLSISRFRVGVSSLVEVLEQLPALENFMLSRPGCLDPVNVEDLDLISAARRRVALPHLKCLDVEENGLGIASGQLLEDLVFPSSTRLSLFFYQTVQPETPAFGLLSVIPRVVSPHPISPQTSLSNFRPHTMSLHSQIKVELWENVCSCSSNKLSGLDTSPPRLYLYQRTNYPACNLVVSALFRRLDLTELMTMQICVNVDARTWWRILSDLNAPRMESLCLTEAHYASQVLRALAAPIRQTKEEETSGSSATQPCTPRFLLPNLKVIHLHNVNLRRRDHRHRVLSSLVKLARRVENGFKLDCISIHNEGDLSEMHLQTLTGFELATKFEVVCYRGCSVMKRFLLQRKISTPSPPCSD